MFGFGKDMQRQKSKSDIRGDMFMAQAEAQDKLYEIAINCRQCGDLGVMAVAYVSVDFPDDPYVEYNRCNCGADVHPRLVSFMRDRV